MNLNEPSKVDSHSKVEFLKFELEQIESSIRSHDDISKSVKNWAVVTWAAAIGIGIQQQDLRDFVSLAAVVPILFWFVDASFRNIQRSFIRRSREIADFVNSRDFEMVANGEKEMEFDVLQFRKKPETISDSLPRVMFFRSVAFLYIGLIAISRIAGLIFC